jgi:hypothetical protein
MGVIDPSPSGGSCTNWINGKFCKDADISTDHDCHTTTRTRRCVVVPPVWTSAVITEVDANKLDTLAYILVE